MAKKLAWIQIGIQMTILIWIGIFIYNYIQSLDGMVTSRGFDAGRKLLFSLIWLGISLFFSWGATIIVGIIQVVVGSKEHGVSKVEFFAGIVSITAGSCFMGIFVFIMSIFIIAKKESNKENQIILNQQ